MSRESLEVISGLRTLPGNSQRGALHYLAGLAGVNPEKPLLESLEDALDYELWMLEKGK